MVLLFTSTSLPRAGPYGTQPVLFQQLPEARIAAQRLERAVDRRADEIHVPLSCGPPEPGERRARVAEPGVDHGHLIRRKVRLPRTARQALQPLSGGFGPSGLRLDLRQPDLADGQRRMRSGQLAEQSLGMAQ